MSSTIGFIRAVSAGTTALVYEQVATSPCLVHATDASGNSALHIAICRQRYAVASFLVKRGAKLDLQSAAALGDIDALFTELRKDPLGVQEKTADGWTALHLACYYAHPKVVAILLAFGADVHATGPSGHCTPLHMAVAGDCAGAISLLIKRGASLSARDAAGFNALQISVLTAHDQICRLLLKSGAPFEAEESQTWDADSMALH
jgi:ankyrin repeat protein